MVGQVYEEGTGTGVDVTAEQQLEYNVYLATEVNLTKCEQKTTKTTDDKKKRDERIGRMRRYLIDQRSVCCD